MWIQKIIPMRIFANEVNIHTGGISSTIGVYPSVKDKDDYQVKFECAPSII